MPQKKSPERRLTRGMLERLHFIDEALRTFLSPEKPLFHS
jgi:hypothetical protein